MELGVQRHLQHASASNHATAGGLTPFYGRDAKDAASICRAPEVVICDPVRREDVFAVFSPSRVDT